MSSISIDWVEISKSKKGVRTIDNKACGVVVSRYPEGLMNLLN